MYLEERVQALEDQVTALRSGAALKDRWATIQECAAELRVSTTTIRRHIETGQIHAARLFGAVRIPMSQFYLADDPEPKKALRAAAVGSPAPFEEVEA